MRWTTGSVIWLALALVFALGGAACTRADTFLGGFVELDLILAAFCLCGLLYCQVTVRRGWRLGLVTMGAGLALVVMVVRWDPLGWFFQTVGFGDRPFDGAVWQAARGAHYGISPPNPRGTMLRSLLHSGRLQGATKDAVTALLGPPDDPLTLRGAGEHWDYEIGWFTGFQMDPDYLVLEFDQQGRVKHWSIVQT